MSFNEIFRFEFENVPTKVSHGKKNPRTHYISLNAIYAGVHYSVRSTIIHKMKEFINDGLPDELPKVDEYPIMLEFIYYSKRTSWDLDNKAALWYKVFLDVIKNSIITNDTVKYVDRILFSYRYHEEIEDHLTIRGLIKKNRTANKDNGDVLRKVRSNKKGTKKGSLRNSKKKIK